MARGRDAQPFDRAIDVQVSRLRKKIEPDATQPTVIKTVRGGGYMFTAKVTGGGAS
jgi:two-component system OmpR family response regulator